MKSDIFREESYRYVPTPDGFRKAGEKTHGKGRHKAHRVGEIISFKAPEGRLKGRIEEVHKEYYEIRVGRVVHRVNRNSILYSLGTFIGRAVKAPSSIKKAYEFGKEMQDEHIEEFKAKYRAQRLKKKGY
jgi:hypothetical protein